MKDLIQPLTSSPSRTTKIDPCKSESSPSPTRGTDRRCSVGRPRRLPRVVPLRPPRSGRSGTRSTSGRRTRRSRSAASCAASTSRMCHRPGEVRHGDARRRARLRDRHPGRFADLRPVGLGAARHGRPPRDLPERRGSGHAFVALTDDATVSLPRQRRLQPDRASTASRRSTPRSRSAFPPELERAAALAEGPRGTRPLRRRSPTGSLPTHAGRARLLGALDRRRD